MRMLRSIYFVCWLAVSAAAVVASQGSANAQGTPEERQACAPDAMRLCSDFIPDVPKITKCMIQKHAQLSVECRRAMSRSHKASPQHKNYPQHKKKPVEMCWGMPCNR